MLSLCPAIEAAYLASTHVSSNNGSSVHLLKQSTKRRRSKIEILEDKAREDEKQQGFLAMKKQLEDLNTELLKAKE